MYRLNQKPEVDHLDHLNPSQNQREMKLQWGGATQSTKVDQGPALGSGINLLSTTVSLTPSSLKPK